MARTSFENLRVYRASEVLADTVDRLVAQWSAFDRDTIGKQVSRAAGSVGANIAEGVGRGSYVENRRFVRIARGSLYETKHWLRRAYRRGLISKEDVAAFRDQFRLLAPQLNAYLRSIGTVSPGPMQHNASTTQHGPLTTDH